MTEVTYELKNPFSYTPVNSGEQKEASFITLKEPSVQNLSACATLKQAFMRAISQPSEVPAQELTEAEKAQLAAMPKEEQVIGALYSSDTDMAKVFLSAQELFKQVSLVDGEKTMTDPMLKSMSIEDMEAMTGVYMANFILASVLKDQ